jgi:transcription elongation factor GreA-like protein/transcription elongation GreA/GreB family factor
LIALYYLLPYTIQKKVENMMETNMAYLKEFLERIAQSDYLGFLRIWEEYCYSDEIDEDEFLLILENSKTSDIRHSFGSHVEKGLHLLEKFKDSEKAEQALSLILDIQTTNSDALAQAALQFLEGKYASDPMFQEKLKLTGIKAGSFQGVISNFKLLNHLKPGYFVYHNAGWGTSEILDVSFLREEVSLECDLVLGKKHLSFDNAFKTLIPLPQDHFLSRRFGNPDDLEKESKENPAKIVRLLLRDLGPKTAAEIKNELLELVIPEKDWNKWWQQARAKIKKDTKIEIPSDPKGLFSLFQEETPHEVLFYQELEAKPSTDDAISLVYSFLRDFPETLKNKEFKESLREKIEHLLDTPDLNTAQRLQLSFFLADLTGNKEIGKQIDALINEIADFEKLLQQMQILSLKKRVLAHIESARKDWKELFLELLFIVDQNLLRDFLCAQLVDQHLDALTKKLEELVQHPVYHPEFFAWYFQKILQQKSKKMPLSSNNGKCKLFEAFLTILAYVGSKPEMRELCKKMVATLTAKRYKVIRDLMEIATIKDTKEFLLLSTKCATFTDHDIKIIHSLAEVAHPSLATGEKEKEEDVIWTTEQGYETAKSRIEQIASKEMIETAREIDEARSHGDLRENAEFKAACEKRDRLQSEMKFLSDQLSIAQILQPDLIPTDHVDVGCVVICKDSKGKEKTFTLLGPWDANPEKNILSIQSRLAQAMKGKKKGDSFTFQEEEYVIQEIANYFEQK